MEQDAAKQLHTKIREVYVRERRKFETRVSGVKSNYGANHMPKWDGTDDFRPGTARRAFSDRYGRSFKPVWPKIADFAFKNNVDPLLLIQTRFLKHKGPRPPEPTDCMSRLALELCVSETSSVDDLNHKLYQFQDVFEREVETRAKYIEKHGWTPVQVLDSVIRDLTLPFNCLYRYYLAKSNGLSELESMFKPGAILEYMRERQGYSSSFWAQVVPVEIVEEATLSAN